VDKLFDLLVTSLWAPETYLKVLILAVTAPFWWPLARVMYREILPALNAPEEAAPRRLNPSEDPFLNIPLAAHRRRTESARATALPRGGPRRRGF
jgi:hypothetical protein